ncbi:MAG: restriction endonuclease subunit S, partial [Desulfobacterales bacterium]|nr:restriction endonuclease subunit S [Desulfobacterales bacterium]
SVEHYDKDPFIQLKENDLLITKDGSIGKVAIVQGLEGQATLNSGVFVTRPLKNQYLTAYLYWILNSSVFSCFIDYNKTGSTVLHLYQDTFENFSFPIPPIQEQKTVCYYLDRKTAQIDNLISKKQKLIELLKEERAATINQAVTKGLNPDAPMKDSGIEWLGKVPEHWEVKRLKYVIALFDHKRVPLSGEERGKMTNKIYDYYGASGIIDRVDNYIFDGEYILIGEDGANLLARNSPLAFKAIGKFWVNNHAHILKPKYGSLDYFTNLLESIDYTIWVSGSAQPKLTAENLANIEIVEPPLKDQTMIVQFIEEKTLKIDNYISKIYQKIELLKEYRTALISEAVTGKIDVRDEESNE